MKRLAMVVAVAGCGRLQFDERGDGGATAADAIDAVAGHDEDGDGVPDAVDVCPHMLGSQLDSDGDRVGDDCDPEPLAPNQQLQLFATMAPGDQPLTLVGTTPWQQRADSVYYDGTIDAQMSMPVSFTDVRMAIGAEVLSRTGPAGMQHQLALALTPDASAPHHFVELNDVGTFHNAAITYFDGAIYSMAAGQMLATDFHPGTVIVQGTFLIGTSVTVDAGWPGEMYTDTFATTSYSGTDKMNSDINGLELEIRWLWAIKAR